MKKVFSLILALAMCLFLCACGDSDTPKDSPSSTECAHTWMDATCKLPKTCSKCGITEGNITDHIWIDATCDSPKTCSVCNITEGSAEHSYSGNKCSICEKLKPSDGLEYIISDDGKYASVTGIGSCIDRDIVIADEYEGLPVTYISMLAFNGSSIKSVVIPDSITKIGKDAFSGCKSLTTVIFGENSQLKIIDEFAFDRCFKLTDVTLPQNLVFINDYAFSQCPELSTVTIPTSVTWIGEMAFGFGGKLTINYLGTYEQWLNVDLGEDWARSTSWKVVMGDKGN